MKWLVERHLEVILLVVFLAVSVWLLIASSLQEAGVTFCFFKTATTMPCPSCGTSRSALAMLNGSFLQSLTLNPLGTLIILVMIILTPWIIFDLITGRYTLKQKMDSVLARGSKVKSGLIIFVAFMLLNWLWNILKGL
jgi:hypothetical protein